MTSTPRNNFKVKDLSLAEWGRKEIRLAESEMPGLMALRERYGTDKPLAGAKIMGSLRLFIIIIIMLCFIIIIINIRQERIPFSHFL